MPQLPGRISLARFFNTLLVLTILVAGCYSAPKYRPVFEGSRWRLTEFDGRSVASLGIATPIELQLDPATHRVSGTSGVNRVAGTYQIAGKRISFGPLMGTRMAGTSEAMQFESEYLAALGKIDEWSMADGKLQLYAGPVPIATYIPIPPPGTVLAPPLK